MMHKQLVRQGARAVLNLGLKLQISTSEHKIKDCILHIGGFNNGTVHAGETRRNLVGR